MLTTVAEDFQGGGGDLIWVLSQDIFPQLDTSSLDAGDQTKSTEANTVTFLTLGFWSAKESLKLF